MLAGSPKIHRVCLPGSTWLPSTISLSVTLCLAYRKVNCCCCCLGKNNKPEMGSYQLGFPSLSLHTPQTPTITVSSSTSRDSHYIGSQVTATAATRLWPLRVWRKKKKFCTLIIIIITNHTCHGQTQHPSIHRHNTTRRDIQQWSSSAAGRGKHAQWTITY